MPMVVPCEWPMYVTSLAPVSIISCVSIAGRSLSAISSQLKDQKAGSRMSKVVWLRLKMLPRTLPNHTSYPVYGSGRCGPYSLASVVLAKGLHAVEMRGGQAAKVP